MCWNSAEWRKRYKFYPGKKSSPSLELKLSEFKAKAVCWICYKNVSKNLTLCSILRKAFSVLKPISVFQNEIWDLKLSGESLSDTWVWSTDMSLSFYINLKRQWRGFRADQTHWNDLTLLVLISFSSSELFWHFSLEFCREITSYNAWSVGDFIRKFREKLQIFRCAILLLCLLSSWLDLVFFLDKRAHKKRRIKRMPPLWNMKYL